MYNAKIIIFETWKTKFCWLELHHYIVYWNYGGTLLMFFWRENCFECFCSYFTLKQRSIYVPFNFGCLFVDSGQKDFFQPLKIYRYRAKDKIIRWAKLYVGDGGVMTFGSFVVDLNRLYEISNLATLATSSTGCGSVVYCFSWVSTLIFFIE